MRIDKTFFLWENGKTVISKNALCLITRRVVKIQSASFVTVTKNSLLIPYTTIKCYTIVTDTIRRRLYERI